MKKVKRKCKRWTQEEIETAISLYESGMNFEQINREIGRPSGSSRLKLQALRIHKVEKVSLWDVESVRGHIIDIDEAKTLTHQSGKRLLFKCSTDGCENTKKMPAQNLVRYGYSCPSCSTGISYPERFFSAYLEVKSIPYETQVIYEEIPTRRYDFHIKLNRLSYLVETHGEQHFHTEDKGYMNFKTIQESDEIKRNYAKNNNINLIELDCRESTFEFIRKQIKDNNILPNITDKEIPNMLELMELNSKYPVKKIIKMYKSGKSTRQIGDKLNISYRTIWNILHRNNIQLRDGGAPKRMVRLVETNQVFTSGLEAQHQTGISNSNISMACNGKLKTAGGYHWEYVDNE